MKLVVENNTLKYDDVEIKCAIGKSGKVNEENKVENDGKTPIGEYNLTRVFYRQDRIEEIHTKLTKLVITNDLGWCDDVSCEEYNQLISLPFTGSYENMCREDHIYDIVIETSHNSSPVIKGKGSAIFMHLSREGYSPTDGCVAISKDDMLKLIPQLDVNSTIEII